MYAILEAGGRQHRVAVGDKLKVELMAAESGSQVSFDKVLMVNNGTDLKVGKPYVDGATVKANIIEHGKGKKVVILKYRPKKDSRRKQGHRQPYTLLEITAIEG